MNMNLYEYIRGRQRMLSNEIVCKFMYQLLKALEFIHRYLIHMLLVNRFLFSFSLDTPSSIVM